MRGLALIAMLAAVVPLVQCVRQNPDVCQAMDMACYPGFHCEQGKCQPDECSSDAACPADRPQCSGGRCGPCTANDACQARAGTPYCATSGGKTGTCVACNPPAGSGMTAEGCAADQFCDGTAYQCRGCVRHSECDAIRPIAHGHGLCVKDALLAAEGLAQGTCLDPGHVIQVSTGAGCGVASPPYCDLGSALKQVSKDQPYIWVTSGGAQFSDVLVSKVPADSGALAVHILGPAPDSAPDQLQGQPLLLGATGHDGLIVSAGARVVLEGVGTTAAGTAIRCAGALGAQTEVDLVRASLGGADVAVDAKYCTVGLAESWVGPWDNPRVDGNVSAMALSDSDFQIVNTVFYHNGIPGTFGGISISNSMGRALGQSYIVNSDFIDLTQPSPGRAAAVDCNSDLGGHLAIVNSIFYTEGLGGMGLPRVQVGAACNPQTTAVASNDPGQAQGAYLLKSLDGLDAANFFKPTPTTPAAIRTGGVARAGSVPVPTVDMDGNPRGVLQPGSVSIGAFEAQ